jgi:hypothetical protein
VAELLTTVWRHLLNDPRGTRAGLLAPSLVWEAPRRATTGSGHWQLTEPGAVATHPNPGEALVFSVARREGARTAFPAAVTVGRVATNDIVLDDTSVSRFHAYLQLDERAGQWFITDAGSRNGTRLDGLLLEARKRAPLHDGAELTLGDASVRFFLPDGLVAFIEAIGT